MRRQNSGKKNRPVSFSTAVAVDFAPRNHFAEWGGITTPAQSFDNLMAELTAPLVDNFYVLSTVAIVANAALSMLQSTGSLDAVRDELPIEQPTVEEVSRTKDACHVLMAPQWAELEDVGNALVHMLRLVVGCIRGQAEPASHRRTAHFRALLEERQSQASPGGDAWMTGISDTVDFSTTADSSRVSHEPFGSTDESTADDRSGDDDEGHEEDQEGSIVGPSWRRLHNHYVTQKLVTLIRFWIAAGYLTLSAELRDILLFELLNPLTADPTLVPRAFPNIDPSRPLGHYERDEASSLAMILAEVTPMVSSDVELSSAVLRVVAWLTQTDLSDSSTSTASTNNSLSANSAAAEGPVALIEFHIRELKSRWIRPYTYLHSFFGFRETWRASDTCDHSQPRAAERSVQRKRSASNSKKASKRRDGGGNAQCPINTSVGHVSVTIDENAEDPEGPRHTALHVLEEEPPMMGTAKAQSQQVVKATKTKNVAPTSPTPSAVSEASYLPSFLSPPIQEVSSQDTTTATISTPTESSSNNNTATTSVNTSSQSAKSSERSRQLLREGAATAELVGAIHDEYDDDDNDDFDLEAVLQLTAPAGKQQAASQGADHAHCVSMPAAESQPTEVVTELVEG